MLPNRFKNIFHRYPMMIYDISPLCSPPNMTECPWNVLHVAVRRSLSQHVAPVDSPRSEAGHLQHTEEGNDQSVHKARPARTGTNEALYISSPCPIHPSDPPDPLES